MIERKSSDSPKISQKDISEDARDVLNNKQEGKRGDFVEYPSRVSFYIPEHKSLLSRIAAANSRQVKN